MSRSGHGRFPQFQRVTRQRPPRAPAAVFAVPMLSYLETFPNTGSLTSTPEDLTWNNGPVFTVAVSGAQAVVQGPNSVGNARAEHDTTTSDMFVQADVTALVASDLLYLIGAAGNDTDIEADQGVALFVTSNGTNTDVQLVGWFPFGDICTLVTLTSTSPVATWRLELDGDTARGYRDGVLICSGSISGALSPVPAGTRAGFQIGNGVSVAIDNFEYGDL